MQTYAGGTAGRAAGHLDFDVKLLLSSLKGSTSRKIGGHDDEEEAKKQSRSSWRDHEYIMFFDLSEMHIQLRVLGAYRGSRLGDER